MAKQSYENWLEELRRLMVEQGIATEFITLSADCWRWYYEDGCTPKEALADDLTYI